MNQEKIRTLDVKNAISDDDDDASKFLQNFELRFDALDGLWFAGPRTNTIHGGDSAEAEHRDR